MKICATRGKISLPRPADYRLVNLERSVWVVAMAGCLYGIAPAWSAEQSPPAEQSQSEEASEAEESNSDAEPSNIGEQFRLDPVVVTATGTPQSSLTAPAFTTVITSDEIEARPASTGLPDILSEFVGVENTTDSLGRDDVTIRGLGGNYSLVLVNGKRVSSADAMWRGGDFDYHSIPLAAIERVEIVRGPMSALYGSDALGGVINIITKKPTDKWTGSIGGEYSYVESGHGGDQYRANAYAAGPVVDGVTAMAAAEYYYRNDWEINSKDNGEVPAIEKKRLANLYSEVTWDITDNQALDLTYAYNNDERPQQKYDAAPSYRKAELDRHTVNLAHKGDWKWGDTLLEVNYQNADIDDYNSSYDEPQQRNYTEENLFLHGRTTFDIAFNKITAGTEYREQKIEDASTYLESGKSEIYRTAVYLQDEINIFDPLTFTLGGRYDYDEIFGSYWTGRANVVYEVLNGVSLKAGVSNGFKAPDPYQTNPEFSVISCGGSCFLSGNPDLEPEKSFSYEAGVQIVQDDWDLSVVGFRSKVDDMIVAVYDPVLNQRNWENINKVDIYGVEATGTVDITPFLFLNANYTYLHTEDNDGIELDNRPKHRANADITWQIIPELATTFGVSFTSDQLEDDNKVPSYTVYDWGITAILDDFRIQAGINNLTNVILTQKDDDFTTNIVGRSYYIGVQYTF